MNDKRQELIESVFSEAVDLDAGRRKRLLNERCANDPELRKEVESLLASHDDSDGILNHPLDLHASDGTGRGVSLSEAISHPETIADYRIVETIGMGGMGVVYLAEQSYPKRRVALKVIRDGLESREIRKRFDHECQVLAKLHHPGIARLYEAGIADTNQGSQPYFAMEWIDGVSLTQFAKANNLGIEERLRLFMIVCDAVQHAHQQAVIHRDLKPANILVDSGGHPRILDFGIAKATDFDAQSTLQRTRPGELVGTLAYMSPEQLRADAAQLDTRSDVYALGVVCFELLSETLPHDVTGKSLPTAARVIDETQPARLGIVDRRLRGDIETIVAKALEKDKARRYPSASELAADVGRFLNREPISARPPTTLYQLSMFATRHKKTVAAAVLIFFSLTAGLVGTIWQASIASRQRDEAGRQARIAEAVSEFLRNDLLSAVDPSNTPDRQITVKQALDAASAKIGDRFADEPIVEASIRHTLGATYDQLGEHNAAAEHHRASLELYSQHLGADHEQSLIALDSLGQAYRNLGRFGESAKHHRAALEKKKRTIGADHFETALSMNNLAAVYHAMGRLDEAESLYRNALERYTVILGDGDTRTLSVSANLANVYEVQGRYVESEPIHRRVLAVKRELLGNDHPGTLTAVDALAKVLVARGAMPEAEALLREALAGRLRVLGDEHSDTMLSMNNLAVLCRERDLLDEAAELSSKVVNIQSRVLGASHAHTLVSKLNLAVLYDQMERDEQAIATFESVIETARGSLNEGHWYQGVFLAKYGNCLSRLDRTDDAVQALSEAHEMLSNALGADHDRTRDVIKALARTYEAADQPDHALAWRNRLKD